MSSIAAIVPCGPDFAVRGRRLVGFVGCLNCAGFMTVRPNKAGRLEAFCDGLLSPSGCAGGTRVTFPNNATLPAYTAADLSRFADDVRAMPAAFREALAQSWGLTADQLEGIARVTPEPEPEPRPEIPPENSGSAGPNPEPITSDKPAPTAGKSGPEPAAVSEQPQPGVGIKRGWADDVFATFSRKR